MQSENSELVEALLQALDQELLQLDRYSHLAFTSRNGIAAMLERLVVMHGGLQAAAMHLNALPLRCCALGADAELLADAGVDDVLTPLEVCTSVPHQDHVVLRAIDWVAPIVALCALGRLTSFHCQKGT